MTRRFHDLRANMSVYARAASEKEFRRLLAGMTRSRSPRKKNRRKD